MCIMKVHLSLITKRWFISKFQIISKIRYCQAPQITIGMLPFYWEGESFTLLGGGNL